MNIKILSGCLMMFLLLGCENEFTSKCNTEAQVIGIDFALCACCGGYLLEVDNNIYRMGDAPQAFKEDIDALALPFDTSHFPINVRVNVDTAQVYCNDMIIDVKCGEVL